LFESQYYINKVGDLDWVSLAPDRNKCRAPLNTVTSLQVMLKAVKCLANGATVIGTLVEREGVCDFESCNEINL